MLYCPGNDGLVLSHEQAWGKAAPGMYLIGYSYFGGYQYSNLWAASTKRPLKSRDKGSIPLFGDVVEDKRLSGNPFNWWFVSHARRLNATGTTFTQVPPEGIHCVTLDGSARWYAYHADPQRSEMEVAIRYPGVSDPGFYWGKPSR